MSVWTLATPILAVAFLPTPPGDPPSAKDDFNAKVVAFARSKVGEKVGDGSCSTLAQAALRDAGAKVLEEPGPKGEYVWGKVVKSPRDARPGDIVQFEKATFRSRKTVLGDDGTPSLVISSVSFPHHTAIVSAVGPKGRTLTVLHQNVGHPDGSLTQIVEEATISPGDLRKGGSMVIYRPVEP